MNGDEVSSIYWESLNNAEWHQQKLMEIKDYCE
nr:MAG TPA: hypothetical protein [Caudoviricetes sp.]